MQNQDLDNPHAHGQLEALLQSWNQNKTMLAFLSSLTLAGSTSSTLGRNGSALLPDVAIHDIICPDFQLHACKVVTDIYLTIFH